jgi:hypothetical protein
MDLGLKGVGQAWIGRGTDLERRRRGAADAVADSMLAAFQVRSRHG